ncbi:COQ9 family protein [Leisingera methylohalidivorans]|uniref:RpsU-divergently transcribed protein n=1 Tax=Leisingera methylohalidivorans DSM 14336 TaxID=999552 RepID=V9VSA5_9RHOB|nr:COQ9 family protein [Leisingera methylohalidivorans]AHC99736.1 rpsU-divergently transcribed protein [Leisingera methylohalidivorans DSM 14336]
MTGNQDQAQGDIKAKLLDAALNHVPFDGWSEVTFRAACQEADVPEVLAHAVCPRGGVDLALAYHARGDSRMLARLEAEDLSGLRFRDKVAAAVRFRLEAVEDKEAVRRGTTLLTLPQYAGDGVKAIWGTCDLIWETLGDGSDDLNWYTKRASLAGVYSATVLFWLGDDSLEHQATWEFLDRRIGNVMDFEKLKAGLQKNPLLKPFLAGPNWLAGQIKPPKDRDDLPGSLNPRR